MTAILRSIPAIASLIPQTFKQSSNKRQPFGYEEAKKGLNLVGTPPSVRSSTFQTRWSRETDDQMGKDFPHSSMTSQVRNSTNSSAFHPRET